MSATKWQHVSESATPVETDGRRIAREWAASGDSRLLARGYDLTDLARRIDEDRMSLVEEIALDDKLLAERGRLLDALPCPRHGRECVPGAIERVEELKRAEADRDALACATHRACARNPGDCCAIGSVIGHWDQHWTEIAQERDRLAGERDALRAALLATRDHDEPDGPCWCPVGLSSEAGCRHTRPCLRSRAALGAATTQAGAATTPDVLPPSIRGLDPNFTTEPAP